MKDWFDEACWFAPSVLILDNLDRILGAEVEVCFSSCSLSLSLSIYIYIYVKLILMPSPPQHADSFPALHLAHTFSSTATPALASSPIVIIATAQSAASLHPLLSTTHLLGETVALRGPNKHARRDVRPFDTPFYCFFRGAYTNSTDNDESDTNFLDQN